MSEYLIQGETLTGIADAIRGKTGGTDPVAVSDMAAQIVGIQAGGGDIDALIKRSTTEIESNVDRIGDYAFASCKRLNTADFPVATSIGGYAFDSCQILTTVNAPMATTTGTYAFNYCVKLTTINLPMLKEIGNNAFYQCYALTTVKFPAVETISGFAFNSSNKLKIADFPVATSIGNYVFGSCSKLIALILRNTNAVCNLTGNSSFSSTPIKSGTGYIYVPSALIEDYKAATNWSTYASQFRALEDYTVDGTTTGELDPAKTGT